MDANQLKQKIPTRYFDYQKLVSNITNQTHIRRFVGSLIKKKYLIRIKKGLYLWSDLLDQRTYSKEAIGNLIYGPSYVSLEYALSFYGLIPERVEEISLITLKKNKTFQTPIGVFKYCHLHENTYPHGIMLQKISKTESFLIATKEKALLDYICIREVSIEKDVSLTKFLEEDLRIDESEFKKLDMQAMKNFGEHYKSSYVKEFLKRVKNG